jgi:hypothetical protein
MLRKWLGILSAGKQGYLQITGGGGRSAPVEVLGLSSERAMFSDFAKLNGDEALGRLRPVSL